MKKYLVLILAVLLVLSFSASAFAIHAEIPSETQAVVAKGATQITLGGELRVRGWYRDGITSGFQPLESSTTAFYDERVRLSVDAVVAPGVKGFVMLESNGGTDPSTSDVYTWGTFNQKPNSLNVNEAWILYSGSGLFGFNSGLKIGHMPLALGQKEFFDNTKFGDDAIVFFMDPMKQLHIGLLTIKFSENFSGIGSTLGDNTNDLDGYVALATYKINDKNTIGANYTYLNNSDFGFSLQNLGVHADGNISGFGYKATGDIQFGQFLEGTAFESDFNGYALQLGLSYNLNPVTLRASAAYGSGDDKSDSDIDTFQTFLGADQHYTFIYDYQVAATTGSRFTGLSNTTYFNLGVDYSPAKELSTSLDGYLIYATETDLLGPNVSDEAGWEVDLKMKYALAKNLSYQIDAGYFSAGNFYDDTNSAEAKAVAALRHSITLNF